MKSSKIFNWMLNNCYNLAVGETLPNTTCPFCNGGINNDKSFSVTRLREGIVYNCYRASCSIKGFYKATENVAYSDAKDHKSPEVRKTPQSYSWATVPLNDSQRSWLASKFNLSLSEIELSGVVYNPSLNTFAWPIRDYRGYEIGILDRSYYGRRPKAISYWFNQDVPKLYFPNMKLKLGSVVLVCEDIISAIKGARHVNTVAVLSANLSVACAQHLSVLYKSGIIAFDNDATRSAINVSKRYNLLFEDGCKVKPLYKDIKDMTTIELENWWIGQKD